MSGKRLLQRIAEWQQGKNTGGDSYDLADAIASDIELLLNSQRGNVLIDATMGLPDLRSLFQSHSSVNTEQLTDDLSRQIIRYEKRVAIRSLFYDEQRSDTTRLTWQFAAQVKQVRNLEINAHIHISMDGKVRVEPVV